MVWIRNQYVSESYRLQELHEMRLQVRALRAKRRAAALVMLKAWLAGRSFPCRLSVLRAAWDEYASKQLLSEAHMGRAPKRLPGFGDRWLIKQLWALGYRILGQTRRERIFTNQRNEWGEPVYLSKTIDERVVDTPEGVV